VGGGGGGVGGSNVLNLNAKIDWDLGAELCGVVVKQNFQNAS